MRNTTELRYFKDSRCWQWKRSAVKTILLVAVQLSGCTNMLPPDARKQLNLSKTTYELCDALTVGVLAPEAVRAEWRLELTRRGATCGSYAIERKEQDARDAAARARFLSALARSISKNQGTGDSAQGLSNPGRSGVVCLMTNEVLNGFSRHCVYDCLGNKVIKSVSSAEICEISIAR